MCRIISLLLLSIIPLFAGVTILEKTPGMIRVRITADTIRTSPNGDSLRLSSIGDISVADITEPKFPHLSSLYLLNFLNEQ